MQRWHISQVTREHLESFPQSVIPLTREERALEIVKTFTNMRWYLSAAESLVLSLIDMIGESNEEEFTSVAAELEDWLCVDFGRMCRPETREDVL